MPTDRGSVTLSAVAYAFEDGTPGLVGVDLGVPDGGFHCLVGRSGSGKTTCLKLAAGLLRPSAGEARIGGAKVDGPAAAVGFVFQTPSLLEWLTVLDNVLLPITLKRRAGESDRAAALELLDLAGIASLADRFPEQISGGQQSRAALARALVTSPPVLMMDEPFAALDALTREELQDDLLRLARVSGATVLFVTHDIGEAAYLADRITVMDAGRIQYARDVDLPRPRRAEMRYAPEYVELCRDVRAAMAMRAA